MSLNNMLQRYGGIGDIKIYVINIVIIHQFNLIDGAKRVTVLSASSLLVGNYIEGMCAKRRALYCRCHRIKTFF